MHCAESRAQQSCTENGLPCHSETGSAAACEYLMRHCVPIKATLLGWPPVSALPALKWSRYCASWPCRMLSDLWDHVAVTMRGVVASHDGLKDVVGPFTWFGWATLHIVSMCTDPAPEESRLHLGEPGERDLRVEWSKRGSG